MDLTKIKAKLEALNQENSSGSSYADKFWKPELGKHFIRIVPSAFDPSNPFTELLFHTTKGMVKYPVLALTNLGQQDPVVDFIKQLRATSDKENWSLSGKISPKLRYFVPIIVRGEEDKGVRLWNIGPVIYKSLLQLAADDEIGDFTDIVTGTDMIVEKVKGDPYPETTVRARRSSSKLSEDPEQVKLWLAPESQPKAVECFKHFSYEEIKKMLEAYITGKPVEEVEVAGNSTATSSDKGTSESKPVEEKKEVVEVVAKPATVTPKPATPAVPKSTKKKFDDLFGDEDEDEGAKEKDDLPF
jgi:hypothetical protein